MAKIGAGSFSAWMRQGLRETRAMLFPESNIGQPAELGMYGTVIPSEVADARRDRSAKQAQPAAAEKTQGEHLQKPQSPGPTAPNQQLAPGLEKLVGEPLLKPDSLEPQVPEREDMELTID